MNRNDNTNRFSLVADYEGSIEGLFKTEIPEVMPILPLRNMVLFPTVIMPVAIGRKSSLKLIRAAEAAKAEITVYCQKEPEKENPGKDDLHPFGATARILKIITMPDHSTTAIIQGLQRVRLESVDTDTPYMQGRSVVVPEILPSNRNMEFKAAADSCKDMAIKLLEMSDVPTPEASFTLNNIPNKVFMIEFICSNLPIDVIEKQMLLSEPTVEKRSMRLLSILSHHLQLAELRNEIQRKTHQEIDKQQREYFLQQQMKSIQDELGGSVQDQDIRDLKQKAAKKKWPEAVAKAFDKEISKLERTNAQTPDYNVQLSYMQTLLGLPWEEYTKDNLDMKSAQKALDKDHYGLEKVKERILEHLAVMKLRGDMKSPILCLVGPPGVGKTSLCASIAKALKRKYVRVSLGGLHDEAEIRGHRRTYIGAMPGRIIKGLAKAGSSNPVFVLDEIDKVTQMTHQGDPSSALLEVLDPEQNSAFHDNYIDLDYDLSKVMFIATANSTQTIPAPLLDRMELIEVNGYITEEKIEIATRHLLPKEIIENGIRKGGVKMSKKTIEALIEGYTRESGVRQLDKKISKILRKVASEFAENDLTGIVPRTVTEKDLKPMLGARPYSRDKYQGNDYAGVVTGLAWTSVGGEILFIETSLSRGKEGKLTLTGNLGDVMKESAVLALEYLRAHAHLLNIDPKVFKSWNIHIHVPEGAVPKDGPSAGVTMATSLASAFTQRKVRANLAMTGEITLRGKVLPVGGIREKILAAKRAGITDLILCTENRKDIEEIPAEYLQGLSFHYVDTISQVWDYALLDEKVKDALDITADKDGTEV